MSWLCASLGILCTTLTGTGTAVDGDTIHLRGYRLRIEGIDAPETYEPGGIAATNTMQELLATGAVSCKDTGNRSHARWVVRCELAGGQDLGRMLVRRGAALDCPRFSGGRYRNDETADARQRIKQKPYC